MSDFFTHGRPGLALFLNAGDPPFDVLTDIVQMLDDQGVDCLELAVPFPDSVTDGPVIRDSAKRALARGVNLNEVLMFIAAVRPRLFRLRIALLADWSHSLKRQPLAQSLTAIKASGADGLLIHALPPRLQQNYYETAVQLDLPVVTTCYHGRSSEDTKADAAANATAYLYLVAHYGRSGTAPATGYADLASTVADLRLRSRAPIAVGFGVRTRDDVSAVAASGADGVIVGSAGVSCVARARENGDDVVASLHGFVSTLISPKHKELR
jgi:tryptophan synthase alpha chain